MPFKENIEKIIKIGLGISLILPLVYVTWTIYPAHFGKTIFFQILMDILLILALYYFFFYQRKIIRLQSIDWLIIIFVFSSLLSAVMGVSWNRGFWGDQSRVQGVFTLIHFSIFYFLLRQFLLIRNNWYKFIAVVIIVSFFSSLIAWFGQYSNFLSQFVPSGARLSGLIGNPIFFANYLMWPVFLSFFSFWFFKEKGKIWRWVWLIIGLVNLVTILGTQTRGSAVGLGFGIILFVILYILFGKKRKVKLILLSFFLAGFLLVSGGYFWSGLRNVLPPRFSYIYSVKLSDTTAKTRLMAWQIAWQGFKVSPLLGNGPESYQDIFDKYYNPEFLKFSFSETVWDQPHNYILEILNSRGLFGLVIYLLTVVLIFWILIKTLRKSENENEIIAYSLLGGGFAAYITQLLFSFETSNSWQMWFFSLTLLLFIAKEDDVKIIAYSSCKFFKVIFVIAAILGSLAVYQNYLILRSSYYTSLARDAAAIQSLYHWRKYAVLAIQAPAPFKWEQAVFLIKDLGIFDGYEKLDKATLQEIGPQLEQVLLSEIKLQPQSYWLKFWLGQLYIFIGEYVDWQYYARAENVLNEAWSINKTRQHIPLLLAKMYLLQGNKQQAIALLTELIKKDESLEPPHWFLGLALVRNEEVDKGLAELEKGKNFGLGFKNNIFYLIDLYAKKNNYKKIVPLYEQLITGEPNNASYYANLAAVYALLNDRERVLENLNRAVELNPILAGEAQKFLKEYNIKP